MGKYQQEHDSALSDLTAARGFSLEHDSALRDVGDAGVPGGSSSSTSSARVAANRSIYGGHATSNGVLTGTTFRSRHVAARDISVLALTYLNAINSADAGTNTVNFKAGIEYPVGVTVTPVTFSGLRTVPVPASAKIVSDDTSVTIPQGGVFYVRTYVSVTAGQTWVAQGQLDGTNWAEGLTASVDSVDTPGTMVTQSDGSYLIVPIAITSVSLPTVGVVIYGDSIASGSGDTVTWNRGYLMRGLNRGTDTGNVPFVNLAFPGETIQALLLVTNGALRKAIPSYITFRDAIVAYGTNDITGGRTLLQIQTDLTTLYTTLSGYGCRVWGVTILPRTTSTDSWATTGNQTPVAGFAVGGIREQLNTWLRTLPAPLSGVLEVADVVETARNSGVWKAPGWTADGTHPTPGGHTSMASVVQANFP